ncbi:methyltransferase family protein [Culicoidibacter larvae]|uniref:Isoprenylcysteine carboxylmethyltransferase family protein n=1 Tax=Culicoidibacter larvae TaxID=2579976 RepID=A0A5R8QAD2_9FIRM|nr:isoprenylcysteine carboxylmethyltransferase family protein [Culicoidibacter larvae]TLG72884.1 isoprenylcysteine carboxylmethyltransferase family protein [Culicoidibacter larvae]
MTINGFVLLIPLLLIRFVLPRFFDKAALLRAALYPPFPKDKQYFLYLYQIATVLLVIVPLFLSVDFSSSFVYVGGFVYFLGIVILVISTINFSHPDEQRLNTNGLYRFSRNPMYVGYFLYFMGCVLLTGSIVLLVALFVFQLSCHWLILAEEQWCIAQFGEQYRQYMKKVRRYF